jgi:hypothetical protein
MKSRPILFSGPMVRALLAGTKTQTRRIVKPNAWAEEGDCDYTGQCVKVGEYIDLRRCPYGQPGDRLWVRETWQQYFDDEMPADRPRGPRGTMGVPATPNRKSFAFYRADGEAASAEHGAARWCTPIYMPRWASRITLEITGVRVERLQEISEHDAKAEGIDPLFTDDDMAARPELAFCRGKWSNYLWHGHHGQYGMGNAKSDAWPYQFSGYDKARDSYSSLWESINGPGSWDANPWVWIVSFRRITTDAAMPANSVYRQSAAETELDSVLNNPHGAP